MQTIFYVQPSDFAAYLRSDMPLGVSIKALSMPGTLDPLHFFGIKMLLTKKRPKLCTSADYINLPEKILNCFTRV